VAGTLWLAAGGCGDAVTAAVLARRVAPGRRPVVLSWAWDRFVVDPVPGPRSPEQLAGLRQDGPRTWRVPATSAAVPPATSTLPRLASVLPADLYLIDPRGGAVGLAQQIGELVALRQLDSVVAVDVGGDVLARGDEPGLRSPLGDALAVAALGLVEHPADVLVGGPGLDGELPAGDVRAALAGLGAADPELRLSAADYAGVVEVFAWHPSEVTGLVYAAARGERGPVRVRDGSYHVALGEDDAGVWRVPAAGVVARNRLARALSSAASLDAAEEILDRLGHPSEIARARRRAARSVPRPAEPRAVVARAEQLLGQGAAVTLRCVAEQLPVAGTLDAVSAALREAPGLDVRPPLVRRRRAVR
jgi:hypothetical protein